MTRIRAIAALLFVICVERGFAQPTTQSVLPPLDDTSKLRVGMMLSKSTADRFVNGRDGRSWGFQRHTRSLPELQSPEIEIYPIVEPGTENDPAQVAACRASFPDKPILVGDRVEDLNRLDVIFAAFVIDLPMEELNAIDQAVSSGRGLIVRQFMGLGKPGEDNPQLAALCGLKDAHFFNSKANELMKCRVVAPHPILGNLPIGAELSFYPNGLCGEYLGAPLTEVLDAEKHADLPQLPNGRRFCPLFVAEHGRGNVVYCAFKGDKPLPRELENADQDRFTVRTVKWLAEQSRSVAATPTTLPAKQ